MRMLAKASRGHLKGHLGLSDLLPGCRCLTHMLLREHVAAGRRPQSLSHGSLQNAHA